MRVALAIVASIPILILSSDVDAFPGSPRQIHEAFIVWLRRDAAEVSPEPEKADAQLLGRSKK
jgi:hypothetical protein